LKTMKIVEFFLIIWGKLSELEPEFFTRWSRSKKDRLRNTDVKELAIRLADKKESAGFGATSYLFSNIA
jgi:hypothetical protein